MNWGEIQIESLKKMFLNNDNITIDNLNTYRNDKKYKTYLYAMPQACNEAIDYICSQLPATSDLYELSKGDSNYYNLSDLIDGFSKLNDVISDNSINWKMINRNILYIENWANQEIRLLCETKPDKIKSNTIDKKTIDLPDEYARLIPLYIAGELYKDDDLTLATMYMNEFMTLLNDYKNSYDVISNPKIETIYTY